MRLNLSTEERGKLLKALEAKGLLLRLRSGDVCYGVLRDDCWDVFHGGDVFVVDISITVCSCGTVSCDHLHALKWGCNEAPWPDRKLQKRKRKIH